MTLDHRVVSANDQALDYDIQLSIVNQGYLQIHRIFVCFASTLKSKIISANVAHKYVCDTKQ